MNVIKFKEEEMKIKKEIVVARKRIRTRETCRKEMARTMIKEWRGKEGEDNLITRVWFFHSASLELCYHCTCAMTSV